VSARFHAVYDEGKLRTLEPLKLPDRSMVLISVELSPQDEERREWLEQSQALTGYLRLALQSGWIETVSTFPRRFLAAESTSPSSDSSTLRTTERLNLVLAAMLEEQTTSSPSRFRKSKNARSTTWAVL
jgi:hypothetical protein